MSAFSDDEDSGYTTRIQYTSRSPSPVSRIQYAVSDEELEIASPQKKKRAYVNPRSTRCARAAPCRRDEPDTPTLPQGHELPLEISTATAVPDSPEQLSDHVHGTEHWIQAETPEPNYLDKTSYLAFLNALDWDDTMFTPLSSSNRLFVVHGWNSSKLEATVSDFS